MDYVCAWWILCLHGGYSIDIMYGLKMINGLICAMKMFCELLVRLMCVSKHCVEITLNGLMGDWRMFCGLYGGLLCATRIFYGLLCISKMFCGLYVVRWLFIPLFPVLWGDYTQRYICYWWKKNAKCISKY
jgi:hypothetical protein